MHVLTYVYDYCPDSIGCSFESECESKIFSFNKKVLKKKKVLKRSSRVFKSRV